MTSYSNDGYRDPKTLTTEQIAARILTLMEELKTNNGNFRDRKACYGRWKEYCAEIERNPDKPGTRIRSSQNVDVGDMLRIAELMELIDAVMEGTSEDTPTHPDFL